MLDFDDDGMGGMGGGFGSGLGSFGGGGPRKAKAQPKVPVSILTGFLGAGKTTLVRHILQNREGLKVGVVINDVAEANIDSEVLAFEDADGIVGLQNGCACCSGRDDLFARLQDLVESSGVSKLDRNWDRLVIECSGVAEPENIARELEAMTRRGEPVMKRVFLAGIICVVDSSTFMETYNASCSSEPGQLPLSALLVSQLESSDTVIVNKADLVEEVKLGQLHELLGALAPTARRITSTRGAVPLRTLLPAEPVNLDMPAYVPTLANRHSVAVQSAARAAAKAVAAPAASRVDGHSHEGHGHDAADCAECNKVPESHARFGLTSFVYRCGGRLFDPELLAAAARQLPIAVADLSFPGAPEGSPAPTQPFAGVLRSKGFVHLAGSEGAYYWSHAGKQLQVAAAPGAGAALGRGQELVFIGTGMDREAISEVLDGCLESQDSSAKPAAGARAPLAQHGHGRL